MPKHAAALRKTTIKDYLIDGTLSGLSYLASVLDKDKAGFILDMIPLVSSVIKGAQALRTLDKRVMHMAEPLPPFIKSQVDTVYYLTKYISEEGDDIENAISKLSLLPTEDNHQAVLKVMALRDVIAGKMKLLDELITFWYVNYGEYAVGEHEKLKTSDFKAFGKNIITNDKEETEKLIGQICTEIMQHFTEISAIFSLRSLLRGEVAESALVNRTQTPSLYKLKPGEVQDWSTAIMGGRRASKQTRHRRSKGKSKTRNHKTKRRY